MGITGAKLLCNDHFQVRSQQSQNREMLFLLLLLFHAAICSYHYEDEMRKELQKQMEEMKEMHDNTIIDGDDDDGNVKGKLT